MRVAAGLIAACLAGEMVTGADTSIKEVAGQQLFAFEVTPATDFSGIAWMGGSDYYAVSDKVNGVFPVRISIEPSSGRVLEVKLGKMIAVKTRFADFEGIAFVPDKGGIYVSAEKGNGIIAIDRETGLGSAMAIPPVFSRARENKSLESLTYDATSRTFWTANEEALGGDGPVSEPDAGTIVRLQKFDRRMKPLAQFAWRTSPSQFRIYGAGTGVSDLAALPDGGLLVMERVVTSTGLGVKIFRAEMKGATDVSKMPRLEGAKFTPAKGRLLFERATFVENFEGIALGPPLEAGWRSLLLIADSAGRSTHYLMPLRVRVDAAR